MGGGAGGERLVKEETQQRNIQVPVRYAIKGSGSAGLPKRELPIYYT